MILIVCHHYAVHGGFEFDSTTISANRLLIQFLCCGGKLGVNLFVLISGYFCCKLDMRPKKAVKLWLDTTLYACTIGAVYLIHYFLSGETGKSTVALVKTGIKSILPIPYNVWWFITTYFVLYLLSGYINKFIGCLSKKQLDSFIMILVVICSVIPTFMKAEMASSNLMWFFLLYIVAARIRFYPVERKFINHSLGIGIGIYILILVSCVAFDLIGLKIAFFGEKAVYFSNMTTITTFLCSVFLFIGFKNINIGSVNLINKTGAAMLGVYLIHDNAQVREFLWQIVFKTAHYQNEAFAVLFLHAIISVFLTFAVCTIISMVYNFTVGKLISHFLDSHYDKAEASIKSKAVSVLNLFERIFT